MFRRHRLMRRPCFRFMSRTIAAKCGFMVIPTIGTRARSIEPARPKTYSKPLESPRVTTRGRPHPSYVPQTQTVFHQTRVYSQKIGRPNMAKVDYLDVND